VVLLFARGVDYYSAEQRTAQMNEDARMAVEVMSLEIAQAGARKDAVTTAPAAITSSPAAQTVIVASSNGFYAGDSVTVEPGGVAQEDVVLTAAGTNTISGIFLRSHIATTTISLFALPYMTGIVPPAGMLPNTSAAATALKFFGDFYDDGNLYYLEYAYDSANQQITKSITPLTQANKNAAEVLIRNVTGPASPFTLYSDTNGAITSVSLSLTVKNTSQKKQQDTKLAARLGAPSVAAASALETFNMINGEVNNLPTTPAKAAIWSAP